MGQSTDAILFYGYCWSGLVPCEHVVLSDHEYQSLVVLPSIRLNHLRQAVEKIVGDRDQVQAIMESVEQHIEQDAHRWGNACPTCHTLLLWTGDNWNCPVHGFISRSAPVELLIAFKPSA